MMSSAEFETVGTLAGSDSTPNLDVDSPRSTTTHNPTKQQVEANLASRWMELSPLLGSGAQIPVLMQDMNKSDLSSDEVTETAVVSNAVGNASGLLIAIIGHFCLRSTYRTGEYLFHLKASEPTEAEQAQMKRNDLCIYLKGGKLNYLVKQSSCKPVQGEIKDDSEGGTDESREALILLRRRLGRLRPGDAVPTIPPLCQKAFLAITHKRGDTYSGKTSTNPLYRACKTLSAFGARLGSVVSAFVGADNPNQKRIISFILSDIFCIVFGIFGIAYFLVRDKILKIPPDEKPTWDLTGLEGWTKYAKTALTFGTAVGQGIGGLIIGIANAASSAAATVSSFSISFWGGVVGVASFVASILFVPLINWVSSKFTRDGKGILTSDNKNKFRNNYTRSGLTLGAGIGAGLGLLIGNWLFGIIMAATIFSALGAVIGAVGLTVYGYRIHRKLHGPLRPGKTDNDEDLENSWDYVTRCTASVFGFIGAAVVCALNPAMALLLVPIGTAIASAIGWGLGLLILKRARSLPGNKEEGKSSTLPWTQRITTGANLGSIIGGCIGLAVGLAGFVLAGPAGVIFAVSLFGAIGAVVGGIAGALYDKKARSLIWQAINPWSKPELPRQLSRRNLNSSSLSDALSSSTAKVLERKAVHANEDPLRQDRLSPDERSVSPFISVPPPPPLLIARSGSSLSTYSSNSSLFPQVEEENESPKRIDGVPPLRLPSPVMAF